MTSDGALFTTRHANTLSPCTLLCLRSMRRCKRPKLDDHGPIDLDLSAPFEPPHQQHEAACDDQQLPAQELPAVAEREAQQQPSSSSAVPDKQPNDQDLETSQQQQDGQQPSVQQPPQQVQFPPARFEDIPDAILGVVWEQLGKDAQRNWRLTCRAVRESTSIKQLIHDMNFPLTGEPTALQVKKLLSFCPPALHNLRLKDGWDPSILWRFLTRVKRSKKASALLSSLQSLHIQVGSQWA